MILMILLQSSFLFSQMKELKGFKLGESQFALSPQPITVGGLVGNLTISKLKDDTIYQLSFESTEYVDGDERVSRFENGIVNNYNLNNLNDYYLSRKQTINGITYIIESIKSPDNIFLYSHKFTMYDNRLKSKMEDSQQNKVNSDF